jgi:hypothetical protein
MLGKLARSWRGWKSLLCIVWRHDWIAGPIGDTYCSRCLRDEGDYV